MAIADLILWREYVAGEVARFYDVSGGVTYIWDDTEAARATCTRLQAGRGHGRAATDEEAAFSGPWHVVRKHVTTEFRQWVEENYGTERLTLSEFIERARDTREEIAFADSAAHTLGQLEELRRLTLERDALIVEASRRGATKVDIARAVGISRQQIHVIVAAADAAEIAPAEIAPVPVGVADEVPW